MRLPADTLKFPHRANGERIRQIRYQAGLSQEKFAEAIGVTRRHLIKLENGEHRPNLSTQNAIDGMTR